MPFAVNFHLSIQGLCLIRRICLVWLTSANTCFSSAQKGNLYIVWICAPNMFFKKLYRFVVLQVPVEDFSDTYIPYLSLSLFKTLDTTVGSFKAKSAVGFQVYDYYFVTSTYVQNGARDKFCSFN